MNQTSTAPPAIDYTDKDFGSLRAALLRLAEQRLPEWTDRSPADLGMLMVDLFAYMGDVVLYYQDRIASELFPRTASERNGIVDLLRLIGYELYPAAPAMADLTLTFRCPEAPRTVTLHYGDRFTTRPQDGAPVEFTYLGPELELALLSDQMRSSTDPDAGPLVHYDGLPVEQSRLTDPAVVIGSSTGEPGQSFALPHERVVTSSVVVEINEGANWVAWERKDALLFDTTEGVPVVPSDPEARHYRLLTDGSGTVHVVFGSARPPRTGTDNVRATYRVCQGSAGNVVAGTISQAATEIAELHRVTNPRPAAGGSDAERADHAIKNAPLAFRSVGRAVTVEDFAAVAHGTGWVAKARAHSTAWNRVDLYVAPAGDEWRPVSEALRQRLTGYFETKRLAGTMVHVQDAQPVPVDISIQLLVDRRFAPDSVVGEVEAVIGRLLAFDRVDFGQTLYQSDFFAAVESVPGVVSATISRLRRQDSPVLDLDAELARHDLPPLAQLPSFLREAVTADRETEERLTIHTFEIPVLGTLDVTVGASAP
ncbi:baseplate J/gp47 family protein [Streptomyces sp. NBC_01445]|uniref:baseplate J/gp47 family protein n=1 Tax=Streptomyces sp. NBC_01445 TaxID=2903869 RepID=UPI002DD842D0|nr:baseplate J/gp47 family protein [Streptomyces sp. NBC_01445]WSE03774.1 baseplate J/gp47 family protein [Streptomyces sp. NBC_01445]